MHTYNLVNGEPVPSVTTVLSVLNIPGLMGWANKLGLDGIDYKQEQAKAFALGTLVHDYIEHELDPSHYIDLSNATPTMIERTSKHLHNFKQWYNRYPFETLMLEQSFVSEKYRYGGKIDWLAIYKTNNKSYLVDFKTGKAIYPNYHIQCAAYKQLLRENGYQVDGSIILHIGDGEAPCEMVDVINEDTNLEIFLYALEIYRLQRSLKGGY